MILVGYIDGTPLSAAEKLAGEIELLYFARRSNETLWAAMNKIEPMRQHELETKMTEMIHAAISAAISAEREACAKLVEAPIHVTPDDGRDGLTLNQIAARAIRART